MYIVIQVYQNHNFLEKLTALLNNLLPRENSFIEKLFFFLLRSTKLVEKKMQQLFGKLKNKPLTFMVD